MEQVITTGGGFQDQVAGIFGGVNVSMTTRCVNTRIESNQINQQNQLIDTNDLHVQVYPIKIGQKDLEHLMSRIVLIYTGTVRLAKNILQNVIRNWYSKNKTVIDCFQELLESSDKCCRLLASGNIDGVGSLTSKYWEQKKVLAPSCEPEQVRKFFQSVSGHIVGGSMAGAGGGGFLFVVLNQTATAREDVIKIGRETFHNSEFQVYDVDIDREGIEVRIGNEKNEIIETIS